MNLLVNQTNYGLIKEKSFIMQKWLDENDILIYSTGNEDKAIVAERFI